MSCRLRQKKSHWVLELLLVVVVAVVVAAIIRAFVAQAFFIPSGSMEDTLLEDDWILVSKVGLWWGDVDRGDVVVFQDPGGWLDARTPVREPHPSRAGVHWGCPVEFRGRSGQAGHRGRRRHGASAATSKVGCSSTESPVDEPNVDPADEPATRLRAARARSRPRCLRAISG